MNAKIGSLLAALPLVFGCASAPRFKDQPVVWRVDDTRDVPKPPEEREYLRYQYFADVFALRRLTRALELRTREPAWNTNALDEVPDSTWFENRIGVRAVTPEEAAKGPSKEGPPKLPLSVVRGKSGGGNPGFVARDATGRSFVIKFDTRENPELQTAADVVVNRIFWTIGYSVPSDHVFRFERSDVRIDPEAVMVDEAGRKEPFTQAALDAILASAPLRSDGSIRAISSEFLPGKPLGGFPAEGVRGDDPNDTVPHEHRRELRGLRVFSAWVDHTDIKEDNTLDTWVEEGGKHFVRHHLLDFGEALGGHAAEKGRMEDGYEHFWDWENQTAAALTLGLWKRPWEDRKPSPHPSVGSLPSNDFDPRLWREAYPYWPFFEMDAADAYWAARIVVRFDRPTLEAIVREAELSDPGAARYLVDALVARRDQIGRAYLEAVSPLDDLRVEGGDLCMVDVSMRHGIAKSGIVEVLAGGSDVTTSRVIDASGRVCVPVPVYSPYSVMRLRVRRGGALRPPMEVHVKCGSAPRVLGVVRVSK